MKTSITAASQNLASAIAAVAATPAAAKTLTGLAEGSPTAAKAIKKAAKGKAPTLADAKKIQAELQNPTGPQVRKALSPKPVKAAKAPKAAPIAPVAAPAPVVKPAAKASKPVKAAKAPKAAKVKKAETTAVRYTPEQRAAFAKMLLTDTLDSIKAKHGISRHTLRDIRDEFKVVRVKPTTKAA